MNIYIIELEYGALRESSIVIEKGQEAALKAALMDNRLGLNIQASVVLVGNADVAFAEPRVLLRKTWGTGS